MTTKIYPVPGLWKGALFLSPRPRGNEWLSDEIGEWRDQDIGTVVSLLTSEEERDLCLEAEANLVESQGMDFVSFPIEDRGVPDSDELFDKLLDRAEAALSTGRNLLIHCRQGVGRTGLIAAGLLIRSGMAPDRALDLLSDIRGVEVPETAQQKEYISHLSVVA